MCDREQVQYLLGKWVLGELPSDEVPRWAADALAQVCEAKSIDALAGLRRPTRAEVSDGLTPFLQELGLSLPFPSEALKVVVDEVARKIVTGALAPCIGATILWGYAHDVEFEFGGEVWKQLSEFEAGAEGCEVPLIVARGGDGRFRHDPVSL